MAMLGLLFRFAFLTAALVGAALLFIYASVLALIFVPIALLAFFFLRGSSSVRWTTVDPRRRAERSKAPPPVIDHDPNDVTLERNS
jgi:hypothetical protein